ncbi:hypothetical protein [Galbibacter pacificus]|uniref:Phosphopeptide-binding protein n=1 Tax=Galbibacter pacificus TaxID=2996052 RepID=A0ABT6FSA4_9FLAO|nr:hypothetical protein [Galbibacter pacificus]MDG3582736.1 hypothetical protein [Galbibacter pacificus]MDG3586145.1 hypothetical protein [Galbibacter pacificus]
MKRSKINLIIAALVATLSIMACKEQKKSDHKEAVKTENEVTDMKAKNKITLHKLDGSPAYSDAVLSMDAPQSGKIAKSGEVDFSFTVKNYKLGAQTESSNTNLLANSDKGQHIHFILNNQPYSAHYEANFRKEIPDGVHYLVAFLSRSYHESVKNDNSFVVKKLEVGTNPKDTLQMDMDAPTLIYSRPKGEYAGKDTENLLLDFFVLNTELSEDGNKVRATINGDEFLITQWAPYVIKGLPKGEVIISLELVDSNGNLIPGPFNKVTRTVILKN